MNLMQLRIVIVVTVLGFIALAAALLLPVYRFLVREEQKGEAWNEALRRQPPPNAPPADAPPSPAPRAAEPDREA